MRSSLSTLESKKGRTLLYHSRRSCGSISWFFCPCMNCVDATCSSFPIPTNANSINGSLRQRRWLGVAKKWLILLLTLVSVFKNFKFNWVFVAKNISTHSIELEMHKEIGLSIKLDEIDTESRTSLEIQTILMVSPKLSPSTQFGPKSKYAFSWKNFWLCVYGDPKKFSLSSSVSRSWGTVFEKVWSIHSLHLVKSLSSLSAVLRNYKHERNRKAL